jgi:hypothetical protein
MKKYIKYILGAALLVTAGSCKKNLEVQNKNAYTYDTYFTSDAVLNQATIATYATLLHNGLWAREWYFIFDLLGYEAKNDQPLNGDLLNLAQYNFGNNQPTLDMMWSSLYRMVFRANVVIDRAAVWKAVTPVELAHQKQYIAEAKFLRAYAYFNLVSLYGRVPLRLSYQQTTDNLEQPRASVTEIWAFVEKDLQDAQADLPVTYSNADLGRASKGAATALLGKAYLYQKKFPLAITELQKLTQAPYTYILSPSYSDLFSTTNQNNKESIFQIMNQTWTDWGIGSQYYVFGGQEINGKATHSDRAQEYGFNDWTNVFITTTAVKAFTYPHPQTGLPYVDPRAAQTFYGDAASGGQTQYCQQCPGGAIAYPFAAKGYHYLKYQYYHMIAVYGGPQSGINGQVIRYADVLLLLAEAYIQQGNTGTEPLGLINQVRARVNAPTYITLGNQTEALRILMLERQLELTGEQTRYFDLIRWGVAKQVINTQRMTEDGTQPFQDKNLLLPIPISEKNANPNVAKDINGDWN